MKKYRQQNPRGFTLPEMLVSIALFAVIGVGTATLFKEIYTGSKQKSAALSSVDQARLVAQSFTNELRNATVGNDGGYPLNEAGTTEIILYTMYGSNGGAIPRVRYFSSAGTLYKGVTVPTGSPLAYSQANEKIAVVQYGLSGSAPLFTYYDDTYNGSSTPLAQPVNINSVNFAQMNLNLLLQDIHGATTTFSIAAGATVRGLKTNLGN